MKIYPYLSYRREINETGVNYTCNLQKVWDSPESLNRNSCSLLIFIRSTIPMISWDFLTRWKAITVRKGKEKGQFWGVSYLWIEVFLKEVLGLLPYEGTTIIPNLSSEEETVYVNFIAVWKYKFSPFFFVLLCIQNLCCNDSTYHSLNWKDVSVTNVDIFEKKQFSLQFFYSLLQVYIVHRVSFIFHLDVLLVAVCTRGFAYLLCWPRGRGIGLVCTRRFSFHEFYKILLFNV